MSKYYCGIGSRQTPPDILLQMSEIAVELGEMGYILRSGHADGADLAFESGAKQAEVWLPWKSFNSSIKNSAHKYEVIDPNDKFAYDSIALHPNAKFLKSAVCTLMARNYRQIVSYDITQPNSSFVVCWTPKGELEGGTAQAIRIANSLNIPVFNLFNDVKEECLNFASEIKELE